MTHAEMDAWSARMPRDKVRLLASLADEVMAAWVEHRLHDTQEVKHLLAWLPSADFRRDKAGYAAGLAAIELAVICAIWPLPLDVVLGRFTPLPG